MLCSYIDCCVGRIFTILACRKEVPFVVTGWCDRVALFYDTSKWCPISFVWICLEPESPSFFYRPITAIDSSWLSFAVGLAAPCRHWSCGNVSWRPETPNLVARSSTAQNCQPHGVCSRVFPKILLIHPWYFLILSNHILPWWILLQWMIWTSSMNGSDDSCGFHPAHSDQHSMASDFIWRISPWFLRCCTTGINLPCSFGSTWWCRAGPSSPQIETPEYVEKRTAARLSWAVKFLAAPGPVTVLEATASQMFDHFFKCGWYKNWIFSCGQSQVEEISQLKCGVSCQIGDVVPCWGRTSSPAWGQCFQCGEQRPEPWRDLHGRGNFNRKTSTNPRNMVEIWNFDLKLISISGLIILEMSWWCWFLGDFSCGFDAVVKAMDHHISAEDRKTDVTYCRCWTPPFIYI